MSYSIITELTESKLIISKPFLKRYNAKDISDILFMTILAFELLSAEFKTAPEMKEYAKDTLKFGGKYDHFRFGTTDLYLLLHVLTGSKNEESIKHLKDNAASKLFLNNLNISEVMMRQYLMRKRMGKSEPAFTRRFLFKLQQDLDITSADYKNMRILIASWKKLNKHRKSLVITRMLQFFRSRAIRSDLHSQIKSLAKKQKLELTNVRDAETGEKPKEDKKAKPEQQKLPWWAKGALYGGAAVAGYKLATRKKKT